MRVEIDLDQLAANVPTWGYVVAGVVAYYAAAGRVMAGLMRREKEKRPNHIDQWAALSWDNGGPLPFMVWLISPIIPPVWVGLLALWVVFSAISGGFLPPPWRKSIWA